MFNEAQNLSLVQTEVDTVFRQNFETSEIPGRLSAMTARVFRPTATDHAVYIGTVHKGTGLFSKIGETQSVPTYVAKVGNKWSVAIAKFAQGINLSKDLFDRLTSLYRTELTLSFAV